MRVTPRLAVISGLAAALAFAAFASTRRTASAGDDATLRGVARGADGPAADADVVVGVVGWAPSAGDPVAAAKTDAEGRFALVGAPLGPIDVWGRAKGGKWKFAVRMSNPGVNDLDVDATPRAGFPSGFGMDSGGAGTVTGVVSDKQGKALAGAAVGLRGDDSTWVVTDDKGQFTLEKAADGDGICARAAGYREELAKVKLDKKRMTIKLKLAAAKPTTVHVNDPAGKPLAGAWVVLGDPDSVYSTTGFSSLFPPRARLVGGWTDANGDAHIAWGGTEDKTVATAYAVGQAPSTKGVVSGGAVTLQVAAPRPARATVTMKDSGKPLAGVFVGLPHESDGGADSISALPQDAERGPVVVGRTDENGQCVLADLDPKIDTLRVVGDMKPRAQVKIERMK